MSDSPSVRWSICGYQKDGDQLVSEQELGGVSVDELRKIFGRPAEDPMFDSYPVGATNLQQLVPYLEAPIDLDAADFFLECHADSL